MSGVMDGVVLILLAFSMLFFCAGTLGLLRFGDTLSRLHALTKADNVGLGLLVAALAMHSLDVRVAIELVLVWTLVMFSGATTCHLLATHFSEEAERDER